MEEVWLPIEGHETRYEVSNKGSVRVLRSRKHLLKEPKLLKGEIFSKSQTQYVRIPLSNPRVRKLLHRLVAQAFIPNPENKPNINHIDNNGLNNDMTNLEWCTQSENLIHAQKQGRLHSAQSKGGITTSTMNQIAATAKAKTLVGQVFNHWTVLSYSGIIRDKESVLCRCSCGTQLEIPYTYLTGGYYSESCKACGYRKITARAFKSISDTFKGKVVGTYTFTGELSNSDSARTTKQLRIGAICNNCSSPGDLLYNKVISGLLKKCKCSK